MADGAAIARDPKARDLDTKRHARLGPSSSDIWLTCESAPSAWLLAPPREASYAAKEGTLAHALCEAAIKLQGVPWKVGTQINVEGEDIEITQEMLNAVHLYVSAVNVLGESAFWCLVEKSVSLDWLWDGKAPEEIFGTADFAAAHPGVLYVVDFKYGRGKAVQPIKNSQLMCYGLGAYGILQRERPKLAASIDMVSLAIVQPRAGGEPVRQWNLPLGHLLTWGYMNLKPTIDRITSDKPGPYVAGAHCWFCPAGQQCPHLHSLRVQNMIQAFPEDE